MRTAIVLALAALLVPAGASAQSRTFVFDHLLETEGGIEQGLPNTFDTTLFITYVAGLDGCGPGSSTQVSIYVFDESTGGAVVGPGGEACDPCQVVTLGVQQPSVRVEVEDLFGAVGATPQAGVRYSAIARSSASDGELVAVWETALAKSSPQALAVFVFEPNEIVATTNRSATSHTRHCFHSGIPYDDRDPASVPGATDARLYLAYHGGRAGLVGATGAAQFDLTLRDGETGQVLVDGAGVPLCAPCSFDLDANPGTPAPSSLVIDLEELAAPAAAALARAGRPTPIYMTLNDAILGDSELVTAHVEIQRGSSGGFVESQPAARRDLLGCPGATAVPQLAPGLTLDIVPNPLNPSGTVRFELARSVALARLAIHDAQGRRVRLLHEGPLAAGAQAIRWDGRDDAGAVAASGVYHLRLDSPEGVARGKVTLLK